MLRMDAMSHNRDPRAKKSSTNEQIKFWRTIDQNFHHTGLFQNLHSPLLLLLPKHRYLQKSKHIAAWHSNQQYGLCILFGIKDGYSWSYSCTLNKICTDIN